ncbi:hypothetical protein ONA91_34700 [Micromonospora sp. DR5-3]|uniref:hypothetical protein n=1 Tax=unclassified Micromonospora TaxID=2617518 RepID=UPI0011DA4438|nr:MULTISPECIES: hypothetical protein [unclassified Micromonospora]MCW3819599.1 hypothetical protein [Micromonospora sp. DR5-3]TYC14247.1 hypothetical protein FXF52_39765 [Micromonospora sp. MP36]
MPDPETRVAAAVKAVGRVHQMMFDDLDNARGGFGWWHGYLGQAHTIFASDYLLQIAGQIGSCLRTAAWHELEFRENLFADTEWHRRNALTGPSLIAERGPVELRRQHRIGAAVDGFFTSCGSALDAIAGAGIGVLSLRTDLVTASWSTLKKAAIGTDRERDRLLAPKGSKAREVQEAAIKEILAAADGGPHGWLPWTLSMRNTLVHRAHRFTVHHLAWTDRRRGKLMHSVHLPRDPQLTDIEAFVLGEKVDQMLLPEHAGDTMAGVLDQLVDLAATAGTQLEAVWQRRRADPELLRQATEQWPVLYPAKRDLSGFAGFGGAVEITGNMHVSPQAGRRFAASRILDGNREFWQAEFTKET